MSGCSTPGGWGIPTTHFKAGPAPSPAPPTLTGDFLLVDPIEEGEKVKAEISFVLYKDHMRYLQQEGLWYVEKPRHGTGQCHPNLPSPEIGKIRSLFQSGETEAQQTAALRPPTPTPSHDPSMVGSPLPLRPCAELARRI